MGDKTQLLSMAFAAKYKPLKVLFAVFLATLLINSLAVAVGKFLTVLVPLNIISLIAALSFIVFGLWIIHGDKLHAAGRKESRFGPVVTVATAFFLMEMGDKTQLATISLAIEFKNVFGVLAGTTLAMVAANAIGIAAGMIMRKHIPEKTIQWISAVLFILFGLSGVYRVLSGRISQWYVWAVILSIAVLTVLAARHLAKPSSAENT